jgi:rhamnose utilization protein RhaD (predicted bifunctional aldolase and dehydrogenase)/NAD(P)-dependent dehydrogenase (short-subunit alcohol dehydrogenase family)
MKNRWNADACRGFSEPELLLYRSNLLGSDLRITNYGGGNTSAKIVMRDPLTGRDVDVLWVKGSGGDLGSMKMDGFATLYLEKLQGLKSLYRGRDHEDEMVGYLPHCTFNLNPRAASIDTPLHCFIPHRHVDHVHADAIIAIAAAADGERLTKEIFGNAIAWVPWQRPGFDLGLTVGAVAARPDAVGLILGSHGLLTWADDSRACYETTLRIIQQAADWLEAHSRSDPFGPMVAPPLPEVERHALMSELAPVLRGKLGGAGLKAGASNAPGLPPPLEASAGGPSVMHYLDSEPVLQFVGSARCEELAGKGTTCPDHFLRTKIQPLFVPFSAGRETLADLVPRLDPLIARYRDEYAAYYERCKRPGSPAMRDPYPVLLLVPGIGLLAFQKDKSDARIAAEFMINTINVMRWAEGVDTYYPIPEQEAFDIEYWPLEEAKLQRLPQARSLQGKIGLVTGGAGGIGGAVARRLLADGACLLLTDIDGSALRQVVTELQQAHGADRVRGCQSDVTNEAAVRASFACAAREFGGIDILVSNAGIASASPVDETTLATWQRSIDILATGYFLVAREGFSLMKRQGRGGSIVFVGSKNALVPSAGAAAYSTAKAAELHLARCLALEGAEHGIRVNVVNPDAVIRGSRIWSGSWRAERAASNRIEDDQVEEFYRQRSLLKRHVLPEDVAEAVAFFASDRSAKSTGNIVNVDAGNPAAFPR